MRRAVEPEPSTRTAGSPSTSAGQATSRSGLRRLVPAASLNRSCPSTGGTRRTGVTEPARHHAADVESSWTTSQPSPSGATAEAAVTGVPSSKYRARPWSTEMSTAPACPETWPPARDARSVVTCADDDTPPVRSCTAGEDASRESRITALASAQFSGVLSTNGPGRRATGPVAWWDRPVAQRCPARPTSPCTSSTPSELMTSPRPETTDRTELIEDKEKDKAQGAQLSATQVAAGALAAVSSAVVASFFGLAGTLIGAALASVISTVSAALYSNSLQKTNEKLRRARGQLSGRPSAVGETEVAPAAPAAPATQVLPAHLDPRRAPERRPRPRWAKVAVYAGAVFVVAMGIVTGIELIGQKPVSALVGGTETSRTTTISAITNASS